MPNSTRADRVRSTRGKGERRAPSGGRDECSSRVSSASKPFDSFVVQFWARVFGGLRRASLFEWLLVLLEWYAPGRNVYGAIDAYILANFALSICFTAVSFEPGLTRVEIVLIAYGVLRVFEIVVYQTSVVIFGHRNQTVRSYRRIVVLSLQGYVEVVFWFAVFYRNAGEWFSNSDVIRSFDGAVYMSVITMATVGYGDIVPVTRAGRLLVIVHVMVAVFLTLVVLARLISLIPQPKELDLGK